MDSHATRRFIGHARGPDGRYSRAVERLVAHGAPLSFRALCERAVPEDSQYLVLDLDRTLHLARNMGELLGWEISAYHGYGADYLEQVEARRRRSRFFLDPNRPLAMARYMVRGLRAWAYPGLHYLFFDKIAERRERTHRWQFRTFGSEPHLALQSIPGLALMHDIAGLPLTAVRALADRVLARYDDDQVIERAELDWLRQRCPNITIILSSASPQPIVEAAAAALGVDECYFTETPLHDDRFPTPFELNRLFLQRRAPDRIAPPSQLRFNAGYTKIERLRAHHPDAFGPNARTVGITDTWQGEDHCWAQYFSRVIDINSITPFPPLVAADSPLEEIHSAQVLTRSELATGDLDPRRARVWQEPARCFDRNDIDVQLADIAPHIETLAARRHELAASLAPRTTDVAATESAATAALEDAIATYNAAARPSTTAVYKRLHAHRAATRARTELERPLSELAYETNRLLERARAAL